MCYRRWTDGFRKGIGLMFAESQLTKRMDFLITRYFLKNNFVLYNLFVPISSAIVLPICWFLNAMYEYKCSTMVLLKLITPKRKETLFIFSYLKRRLFFFFLLQISRCLFQNKDRLCQCKQHKKRLRLKKGFYTQVIHANLEK